MIGHLFNTPIVSYRPGYSSDGAGGRSRAFTLVDSFYGQVNQPTTAAQTVAAQTGANLTHVVHVARSVDVRRGDEIETKDGLRLRVVAVVENSRRTYKRLDCEAVQGE